MDKQKNFPKNFFWGASTAAHQVEGGNYNQWTVWELETAAGRAKDIKRATNPLAQDLSESPLWEDIEDSVRDPNNYVSGRGVEHYQRYEDDFAIAEQLNLNAFRFSVEWSRLEPREGEWDEAAFEHYRHYIAALKKRGLEPFLNIWHWTNPCWFEDKGGFVKKSNLKYFDRFVRKIAQELCGDVRYVLTVNEANSYMAFSYFMGAWPPQEKNPLHMAAVYYNLMLAHKRAYRILKRAHPALQVGAAHQATLNLPKHSNSLMSRLLANLSNYFWHGWFYSRINKYQDFLGMNFYFVNYWNRTKMDNPLEPLNDLGWYMEPKAIGLMLKKVYTKYGKPIIITENGVADMHDQYRQWWIEESLSGVEEALTEGVDIRGYFHWSLLDNFEWAEGWWPKFGLVEVDRKHGMKRTVRPSAKWFAEKIRQFKS